MSAFEYSAGAFIYRRSGGGVSFLILKKRNGEHDLAKGHIEKGETAIDAAKREIKEETGIDAEFDRFFLESTKYFFFKKGKRIMKQVKFFLCEVKSDKVAISKEHLGYEWCDYNEAVKKLGFKDLVGIMSVAMEYIRRKEQMERINAQYARLAQLTKGWSLSRRLVPGEGRLDAKIMLIGQAPGANEDEELRPFIGRSGKLLDSLLKKAKISRRRAYITSVVQFFPPKNRMPTREEVALCKPFLIRQLELVRPRYVVTLGNLSSSTMLGIGEVEKNHGRLVEKGGIDYLITFHPAAALRFKENYGLMLDDFRKLAKRIGKNS